MNLNFKQHDLPSLKHYKLDRMIAAAKALGNPQLGRDCILVAGTNGKGSTVAFISKILEGMGRRVGSYYSPHVVDRTERIQINSQNIEEERLKFYEKKFGSIFEPLSYFERMTCLAFLIFKEQNVDVQVLEVGMGGRLDATNISEPQVSVITSIGFDHQEVLGSTLSAIAGEKAGVMRSGRPCVVSGWQVSGRKEVSETIRDRGDQMRAKLIWADSCSDEEIDKRIVESVSDLGDHQVFNARAAVHAVQQMASEKNWKLPGPAEIQEALINARLPARIQVMRKNPLFIVDGAHNEDSARMLNGVLEKHWPHIKFHGLFGVMRDKDFNAVLSPLKTRLARLSLASFYPEREYPPKDLAFQLVKNFPELPVESSARCAGELGKELWKSSVPVLVFGSFYLAGQVLRHLPNQEAADQ